MSARHGGEAQLLCGGRIADYDRVSVTWHGADRDDEVVALEADVSV